MEKPCKHCAEVKPLALFPANGEMADGHLNVCKACKKTYLANYRQGHAARLRSYDRARACDPQRVARTRETVRKWVEKHPERAKAISAVNNAIRDGRLTKWPACAVPECASTKPVAHHPDYDQPLSVVWLCQSHHKLAHEVTKGS